MVGVMAVTVKQTGPLTFEVSVAGPTPTTHVVVAPEDYVRKLTAGRASASELVEKSFEFLLEREPNTSILRSFELQNIQQYFPEFEQTISGAFAD